MQKNKSGITKKGILILVLIGIIYIAVLLLLIFSFTYDALIFLIRLFGLWGYVSLSAAAIMTPFLKEIASSFGKPFIKIHHIFAFSGLALITLHPVFYAIYSRTASVFIPSLASWYDFWLFAGRPALIILYLALVAILLRKKFKPWRIIHALMYLTLVFGFVHAVLLGTDFANAAILAIYSILFVATAAAFIVKRIRLYKSSWKKKSG